jgi:hypothetical protein
MGSMSNYYEGELLNYQFSGATDPTPTSWYLAAFTTAPTDSSAGTEVTGGSYARVTIARNSTNFPEDANPMLLAVQQDFVQATANWGTIAGYALMDASTGGNVCYWTDESGTVVINTGNTLRIPANTISITGD